MPRVDYSGFTLADLDGKNFATVPEAAAVLEMDPRTVIAAIESGNIPAVQATAKYRVPVAWLRTAVAGTAVAP
jgi:hypothetical protein